MGPAQAIRTGIAKSFQFSGRASRSEFWWFTILSTLVVMGLLFAIDFNVLGLDPYGDWVYAPTADTIGLLILPATLSVTARRMQDRGLPGLPAAALVALAYAVAFVPVDIEMTAVAVPWYFLLATNLAVLIIAAFPSAQGANPYGPPPYGVTP